MIIHPEPLNTPPESRKISEISSLSITKVLPPVALDIELDSRLTEEQVSEIQHQEILSKEIEMEIRDIEIKGKADDYEEFRGVLLKKGKLGTWKEWYFCVVGPSLCYYESAKLQKKKGEYEISKIKSIGMQGSKKKKNKGKKLQINMEKNQVILKAKNEQEAKKWEEYLNYVVQMYQINNI